MRKKRTSIDIAVIAQELIRGDSVLGSDGAALVARGNLVVTVAVGDDTGHLRRVGRGGSGGAGGGGLGGGCRLLGDGSGDMDADVVAEPKVGALCVMGCQ